MGTKSVATKNDNRWNFETTNKVSFGATDNKNKAPQPPEMWKDDGVDIFNQPPAQFTMPPNFNTFTGSNTEKQSNNEQKPNGHKKGGFTSTNSGFSFTDTSKDKNNSKPLMTKNGTQITENNNNNNQWSTPWGNTNNNNDNNNNNNILWGNTN